MTDNVSRHIFSSLYLAPVEYYAALFGAGEAVIDIHENYQKQSYRNRCNIAGANGMMPLSIPIEKPAAPKCPMKEIRIAQHGNWRHLHWNAIVSAYRSTPFFEYYEDELRPFYEKHIAFLVDFNIRLHQLISKWLQLPRPLLLSDNYIENKTDNNAVDFRETIHPKRPSHFVCKPYYQVFAAKHGFIPNLSIIDLLFNMGNEARMRL